CKIAGGVNKPRRAVKVPQLWRRPGMLCMNTTHRITQTLSESLKERCQAHLCAKQKWNKHWNLRIKDGRSALTDWKIRQVNTSMR
ncbi:hypothetical protein D9H45_26825, partial [Escherichia coli]|nr:hypothetical protein [Escherichia coli]MGQ76330.1 hypothetical protein [Escherichia coli]